MQIQVKIAKLNEVAEFDVEKLPPTSLAYAIQYGLTQAVNDVHAAVARKNFSSDALFLAAVQAKVSKRIDQILSGDVPGSRAPIDPNAAKARKLAKELSDTELDAAFAFIMETRRAAAETETAETETVAEAHGRRGRR